MPCYSSIPWMNRHGYENSIIIIKLTITYLPALVNGLGLTYHISYYFSYIDSLTHSHTVWYILAEWAFSLFVEVTRLRAWLSLVIEHLNQPRGLLKILVVSPVRQHVKLLCHLTIPNGWWTRTVSYSLPCGCCWRSCGFDSYGLIFKPKAPLKYPTWRSNLAETDCFFSYM